MQASSTKRVRPLGGDDLAVAENGLSPGVDSGVDDSPSARDMAERIRKVRADIAETINLQVHPRPLAQWHRRGDITSALFKSSSQHPRSDIRALRIMAH